MAPIVALGVALGSIVVALLIAAIAAGDPVGVAVIILGMVVAAAFGVVLWSRTVGKRERHRYAVLRGIDLVNEYRRQ
jgi:predicted outer membrane lipoprotein